MIPILELDRAARKNAFVEGCTVNFGNVLDIRIPVSVNHSRVFFSGKPNGKMRKNVGRIRGGPASAAGPFSARGALSFTFRWLI
jgi:hypothetical protein